MRIPTLFKALATGLAIALASIAAAPESAAAPARPIVQTTAGKVAGTGGAIETFKGIPYAAPPVGPLRWRPPRAPRAWAGARDARRFGADCMQTPYVIATGQPLSEDCLTANVWTPRADPKARRPVMVYIYGGAFLGGSGAYSLYDGAKLARDGVVVVNFNYRVGIFGFLAHPGLSAQSPRHTSGNYGLLDQIAALNWVKANIASFGGDPNRVTVFGESAGAMSIADLMTSPLAKGLFQGAIIESGGLPPMPTLAEAEQAGASLGDVAALRRMSAKQLLALNGKFTPASAATAYGVTLPSPTIDGYVLPRQPRAAFAACQIDAVPTIIGYNAEEGRMSNDIAKGLTVASYHALLAKEFGDAAPAIEQANPAASDADAPGAMTAILGDAEFNEGSRLIARALSKSQPKTFAYLFTKSIGGAPLPPTHSEETAFVFGTLDQPAFVPHRPADASDRALSSTMTGAWARFAATGDPNGPGLPAWPAYDTARDPYLELGAVVRAGEGHRTAQIDAMEAFKEAP